MPTLGRVINILQAIPGVPTAFHESGLYRLTFLILGIEYTYLGFCSDCSSCGHRGGQPYNYEGEQSR